MLLMFLLSGCQMMFKGSNFEALNETIKAYFDGANQFEVKHAIVSESKLIIEDFNGNPIYLSDTDRNSSTIYAQKEPYYILDERESVKVIETREQNNLVKYIMTNFHHLNDRLLYQEEQVALEDSLNPFFYIDLKLEDIAVRKFSDANYEITGKLEHFIPITTMADLKAQLIEKGMTEADINDIEVDITFYINEDILKYSIDIEFKILSTEVSVKGDVTYTYQSFDTIDIHDESLYYPVTILDDVIPIDADNPIEMNYKTPLEMTYYTYLEPGRYGFNTMDDYPSDLMITLSDESRDPTEFLVFKDVYDQQIINPFNIEQYYDIKEAGYYYIDVKNSATSKGYSILIEKIALPTDDIEPIDLIVTDSGTYAYDIDNNFDFFAISFDLEVPSVILISVDNLASIYKYNWLTDLYISGSLNDYPYGYAYLNDAPIYINNPYRRTSGHITFDIKPFIQSLSLDDPLLELKNIPNEDYFYASLDLPAQYASLTVTEQATYTFHMDELGGNAHLVKGLLMDQNHNQVSEINHLTEVTLTPGTYYYKTDNVWPVSYSMYVTQG